MSRKHDRIDRLRKLVDRQDCDAALITNFTNVTYLTGFTGDDSYLYVHRDGEMLLTDSRYTTQLEEECPDLDLVIRSPGKTVLEALVKLLQKAKPSRLAVESTSMTVDLFQKLGSKAPRLTLVPTERLVEQLRVVKDRSEVAAIRSAIDCAERAIGVMRASLRADRTEKEIADELEHQIRLFGGTACSFPPIVAVGPRAALPHAIPTDRQVGTSDFVLIDWGARKHGYVSDLTRVFATGRISPKLRRIYEVVLRAQRRAIEAIRPGVALRDVDAAARSVIAAAGHRRHFGHGLGHGIGLEIHEGPRIAPGQVEPLRAGMVVTVEPGIYLPGWGGVRIEDDVLVTRNGHEVLSRLPRELDECVIAKPLIV